MDAKEIFERLQRGSSRIDSMRYNIKTTVEMLLGFICGCPDYMRKLQRLSPLAFDGGEWVVHVFEKSNGYNHAGIYVSCKKMVDQKMTMAWTTLMWSHDVSVHGLPTLKNVQWVHDSLPILISGLIKALPELVDVWDPLIKASCLDD